MLSGKPVYCPPPNQKGSEALSAFERFLADHPAIRDLFSVKDDRAGNLPPMPAIFPDQLAPIVRVASDGGRESVITLFHRLVRPLFDGLSGGWADHAPTRSSMPSCSRPSRTLRAADAVARRRAILDRRCARRHGLRPGRDGRMAPIWNKKDGMREPVGRWSELLAPRTQLGEVLRDFPLPARGRALSEQRQVVCVGRSKRRPKRRLGREGAPLGQRGGAPLFVNLAGDEMALLIEMVVDLGMN